jgi:hypothetical protein
MVAKKGKTNELNHTTENEPKDLSGKFVSLFFMVNSLKDILEGPQNVMPTQVIAKHY